MNCSMEARLSTTALDRFVSWPKAVHNLFGQVPTVFAGIHFDSVVSTKFFSFA